jgi:hypothetical protein
MFSLSGLRNLIYIIDDLPTSAMILDRLGDRIGNPVSPEKDWEQTRFVSGGPTSPSEEKRAKLRAKRKKKK